MRVGEVVLFETDPEEDIATTQQGEQQMPAGHGGRREERREEAGHHRVPDQAVGQRMMERRRRLSEPAQVAADLAQPEEVEVVDGERHGYDRSPSRREHRHNTNRAAPASTCHTTAGIGRHCQVTSASTGVAARTKVDRST